jgi:hypothetical protein
MISFTKRLFHQIKSQFWKSYRKEFESALAKTETNGRGISFGRLLVDGMWDNPNYWLRYSMLHALNKSCSSARHGFIGKFNRRAQRRTMANFGINSVWDYADHKSYNRDARNMAEDLIKSSSSSYDIFNWELPHAIPGCFLYDYVLKRQRAATVQLDHPDICDDTQTFIGHCCAAEHILNSVRPETIILSHPNGLQGPMAWIGINLGAQVILPFGQLGIPRFVRMRVHEDLLNLFKSIPSLSIFSSQQQTRLAEIGKADTKRRLDGFGNDLGGRLSFGTENDRISVNKESICREFGWPLSRPIVGLYANCWYDWPNCIPLKNFRDFHDWIKASLSVATDVTKFSWLLRPHPAEDWYGGVYLKDLVGTDINQHQHIRISPKNWGGKGVLNSLDAVVTIRGTVGMEAASIGIPVLTADEGWYDHLGFVKCSKNRKHHLQLLQSEWWTDTDRQKCARLADIAVGTIYGRPASQKKIFMDDDTEQWKIYRRLLQVIEEEPELLGEEIRWLKAWYDAGHSHFHTFKMQQSDDYI